MLYKVSRDRNYPLAFSRVLCECDESDDPGHPPKRRTWPRRVSGDGGTNHGVVSDLLFYRFIFLLRALIVSDFFMRVTIIF